MHDLTPAQFSDFFRAVHSTDTEPRRPFEWQKRLAAEVLADGWPDVVRVPTGCGKTAVLDLAVFELALQADRTPRERTAPRRTCLVVDRRLVVDEAAAHARRILRAIQTATPNTHVAPVLRAVAERLRALSLEAGRPLKLVRLRGGVYRDDGWASDPLTPTILVSTVDQIGSRLLFRGYGVSRRNLPVHAGLLAFDTRIIVDEAHLSTVFTATLDRVRRYQGLAEQSPLPTDRRLGVVRMSATVSEERGERSFMLSSGEREDPALCPRLEARKEADLIEVEVDAVTKKMRHEQSGKAREQERRNREKLVIEMVREARRLVSIGDERLADQRPCVIGVVVNRVATARQVFESLQNGGDQPSKCDSLLLTGRIRPFDRDCLLDVWLPKVRAGRKQEPEKTLFVVATQTVEVGANLDFDALVTEAGPLDALRQRFGRLDRLGKRYERGAPAPASIVIRKDQTRKSEDDPVYGAAVPETWKWLRSVASTVGGGASRRRFVEFGVNRLDRMLSQCPPEDMAKVLAQPGESPLLFPAHLDAWVQTNPRPVPDPDVAPFLHGRADTPADVQVVWRADLDPERSSTWPEIVSLMPPLTREALPVPAYAVRAWLKESKGAGGEDVADIEGKQVGVSAASTKGSRKYQVLRWKGRDDIETVGPDGVRPGDTIIVPAKYGGCDRFGWNPLSTADVDDVADRCLVQLIASYPQDAFRRPKLRLRLHPDLLPRPDDETRTRLGALLSAAVMAARFEGGDAWPAIRRLLEAMGPHLTDSHLESAVDVLLNRDGRVDRVEPYPKRVDGIVIVDSVALQMTSPLPEDEAGQDEPDGDEASFGDRQVPLTEHLDSVGSVAEAFARGAGLSRPTHQNDQGGGDDMLARTLGLTGRWHDEGKRDVRFQAWLRGGELKALAASDPIAKSGRDAGQWKPSTLFGYPRGARHEFVSVRLFEQAEQAGLFDGTDGCVFDLAKFIIGTHHGFGRPFPPVDRDTSPIAVKLVRDGRDLVVSSAHQVHRLDSGWVDLFWRMVRRYGWWGLAYLEALLVTADRTVSAREQSGNVKEEKTEEAAV